MKNIELTDGEILLKPFSAKDAEKHLAGEDEEQQKWISKGRSSVESVKKWIEKNLEFWRNNGPIFNFAIWTVKPENLIGMIEANTDFKTVEGIREGDANISYGLYPEFRGKGYMGRAISLVLFFLKEKGLKCAIIRVDPRNTNSLKIPRRYGFKEIGTIVLREGRELIIFSKDL